MTDPTSNKGVQGANAGLGDAGQTGASGLTHPDMTPPGQDTLQTDPTDQISHSLLTGEITSDPEASKVEKFFTVYLRAISTRRMYSDNEELCDETLEETFESISELLREHNTLALTITTSIVSWKSHLIFDLKEHQRTFLLNLYRDGIRQLTFTRGLTLEEMSDLVDILGKCEKPEHVNDDLSEIFSDRAFKYVTHVKRGSFISLFDNSFSDPEVRASAMERFRGLVNEFSGTQRKFTEMPEPRPVFLNDGGGAILLNFPTEVSEETLDNWKKESATDDNSMMLTALEQFIIPGVLNPPGELSSRNANIAFSRLVREWIFKGDFKKASRMMNELGNLLQGTAAWDEIIILVCGYDSLLQITSAGGPLNSEAIVEEAVVFFLKFKVLTDVEVTELATGCNHQLGMLLLVSLLVENIIANPSNWEDKITKIPTVIIAHVLTAMKEQDEQTREVLAHLFQACFTNENPAVAAPAITLYPGQIDELFRKTLLDALRSNHLKMRCAALIRIQTSEDASFGAFLMDRARKIGVAPMEPQETRLLLDSLAALGGDRYLPFFRQQLARLGAVKGELMFSMDLKTLLKVPDEVKSILLAVTSVGTPRASKLLLEVKDNARGQFKTYCEELLKRISSTASSNEKSGFDLMENISRDDDEGDVTMTASITGSFRALMDKVKGNDDDTVVPQASAAEMSQPGIASTLDSVELFLDEPEHKTRGKRREKTTSGSFSRPPTGVFEAISLPDTPEGQPKTPQESAKTTVQPELEASKTLSAAEPDGVSDKRQPAVPQRPSESHVPSINKKEEETAPVEKALTPEQPRARKKRPPSADMKGTGIFKKVRARRTGEQAKQDNHRRVVRNTSSAEFIKEPPGNKGSDS